MSAEMSFLQTAAVRAALAAPRSRELGVGAPDRDPADEEEAPSDLAAEGRFVMVVEDDPDVRDAITDVLCDEEYQTLSASDGQEALDRLRASPSKPYLILLDIMMPVMDGWRFRQEQMNDPELADIPVVVCTAHGSGEDVARDMGADGFLKKPLKLSDLLALVEKFCGPPA